MITARKKLLEYLQTNTQRATAKKTRLCQATICLHAAGEGGEASPETRRKFRKIGILPADWETVSK